MPFDGFGVPAYARRAELKPIPSHAADYVQKTTRVAQSATLANVLGLVGESYTRSRPLRL